MTALNRTIGRHARELLAVLVTIMFLVALMAKAAPETCDNHLPQVAHVEACMDDVALRGDRHGIEQTACCKTECSLCNAILPASSPANFRLESGAQRYLDPQRSVSSLSFRPRLGPP